MANYLVNGSINTIGEKEKLKRYIYSRMAHVKRLLQNGTEKEKLKVESEKLHDFASDILTYTIDTKIKQKDKKEYKFYIKCFGVLHGIGEDLLDEYYYKEDKKAE